MKPFTLLCTLMGIHAGAWGQQPLLTANDAALPGPGLVRAMSRNRYLPYVARCPDLNPALMLCGTYCFAGMD